MVKSFIQAGKKERNELYLPPLRYIVADDWIEKLGHDAFIAWLKMHTWVDRTDEHREYDRVPYSLEDTWKKLGMGKKKFYQKVLRPLWEYGLVDVVEYEESDRSSQKPKNIIVYTSPANTHETETKPLVKLRDWDKDYGSASQFYGKKGGRPKKQDDDNADKPANDDHGFQTETVEGTVSKRKRYTVSKRKRYTVSDQKPNNTTNTPTNETNTPNNDTNQQQQGEPVADQDQDVVVGYQNLIESKFGKTLKENEIKTLMKLAVKNGKSLKQCIRNAKEYITLKKQSAKNPMGLIRYEIEVGYDLETLRAQVEAEKNQQQEQQAVSEEEDLQDLPMAIRLQMEREKAAKEQQQQPSDSEEEEEDKESLAEKRARIQAKLEAMRKRFEEKNKPSWATS